MLVALPLAPSMSSQVVDQADLLKRSGELAGKLEQIYNNGGPQIAVLTVDDLGKDSIESLSLSVARSWALGRKEKDDGMLIVIAKKERKVRIEVGYGLEDKITPPIARDLIHQFMLPEFRVGKFQKGIEGAIYRSLEEIGYTQAAPKAWQITPRTKSWKSSEPIFVGLFFLILIISILRGSSRQTRGRRYTQADGFDGHREYWSNRPSMRPRASNDASSSWGSSSMRGSGGAGGSFGGSGASGSW